MDKNTDPVKKINMITMALKKMQDKAKYIDLQKEDKMRIIEQAHAQSAS